jgi:WD40 repeat protein
MWDLGSIAESNFVDGVPLPGTMPEQDIGRAFDFGTYHTAIGFGTYPAAIAIDQDVQTLAAGFNDGKIILLDVPSGAQLPELRSLHTDTVIGLSFSDDGSILVSVGLDGQIIFWNVDASSPNFGQPIASPIAGPKLTMTFLPNISFSLDRRKLAVLKPDGSILLWTIDIDSWRSLACQRAGRNLTQEEWRHFFGDEPYHMTCPDLLP